jgi:hypothetical protein
MKLRAKQRVFGSLICFGLVFVSGCSSASKGDEAIRASNCALIADWNTYTNDPSTPYFQGDLNTYQTESEKEDRLWLKLQTGDKSYDALIELRKLNYSQHYWIAPPMGEKVTLENVGSFSSDEDLFDDEASWKIIENVRDSCPTFPKEYLAEMFSGALLI